MIQRLPKVNVIGIVAMCATFVASALLVRLFVPQVKPFCGMHVIPSRLTSIPPGLIRYQADAPIKFIGIDEKAPGLGLIARNVSERPITGYALACSMKNDPTIVSISHFDTNTRSRNGLDKFAVYRWEVNFDQIREVWVDFVEFSDGTIWGPNTTRTLEKMNATRIGSRQAALEYEWVLDKGGTHAMLARLSQPVTNTQIEQYDEIWGRAFDSGVEEVVSQLLSDLEPHVTTSLGKSDDAGHKEIASFQATLSSYINFRRR